MGAAFKERRDHARSQGGETGQDSEATEHENQVASTEGVNNSAKTGSNNGSSDKSKDKNAHYTCGMENRGIYIFSKCYVVVEREI